MNTKYKILSTTLRCSAWIQTGWKYEAPVRPDRLLWIEPNEIQHKPTEKPPDGYFPPTVVVGGNWDRNLERISNDIVYKAFYQRFVEKKPWKETGYVEFLSTDVSEHGDRSTAEALERCKQLDKLYKFIDQNGYMNQRKLEQEESLFEGLTSSKLPPAYREIAVNITRDGEFVWHAGMHRLVIAQLLDIDQIPVRVHIRHKQWQDIRDMVYSNEGYEEYRDHPDIPDQ